MRNLLNCLKDGSGQGSRNLASDSTTERPRKPGMVRVYRY
jgi:hypothetical protein